MHAAFQKHNHTASPEPQSVTKFHWQKFLPFDILQKTPGSAKRLERQGLMGKKAEHKKHHYEISSATKMGAESTSIAVLSITSLILPFNCLMESFCLECVASTSHVSAEKRFPRISLKLLERKQKVFCGREELPMGYIVLKQPANFTFE